MGWDSLRRQLDRIRSDVFWASEKHRMDLLREIEELAEICRDLEAVEAGVEDGEEKAAELEALAVDLLALFG